MSIIPNDKLEERDFWTDTLKQYLSIGYPKTIEDIESKDRNGPCKESILDDNLKIIKHFYGANNIDDLAFFFGISIEQVRRITKGTSFPSQEVQRRVNFLLSYLGALTCPMYKITNKNRSDYTNELWKLVIRGEFQGVISIAKELISRGDNSVEIINRVLIRNYLAISLRETKKYAEAIEIIEEALEIAKGDSILESIIWSNKGSIYYADGLIKLSNKLSANENFIEAKKNIIKAIELNPTESELHYNQLNAESRLKDKNGCITAAAEYVKCTKPLFNNDLDLTLDGLKKRTKLDPDVRYFNDNIKNNIDTIRKKLTCN